MTQETLPEDTESEPVAPPPPPIEAPPQMESLAEQVHREAHTVPESTGPSDIVPNRPNIRPPGTEEIPVEEGVDGEGSGEPEPKAEEESTLAADLIAEADAAETAEELDHIESLADGRKTVLGAVERRREELGIA